VTMVDYLPLMNGWELQSWFLDAPVTLVKNRIDLIKRFDDYDSWLLGMTVICDDAFISPYIHYPSVPLLSLMPYGTYRLGGMSHWSAQSPFCPLYYQPNPLSSAGLYTVIYDPAYPMANRTWGILGKKGEFRAEILGELDTRSTQTSAHVLGMSIARVVITDSDAFRKSLKEVLGTNIPTADFCRVLLAGELK
jgi:hypothetical protein